MAPPTVVPTWGSLSTALADVLPTAALPMVVHCEHDIHLFRPLVAGRRLATSAAAFAIRPGRSGTRYTVRLASTHGDPGEPVVDQYVTLFVRGVGGGESGGAARPDHAFPPDSRSRPIGRHTVVVDPDQTTRYGGASGDHNPIHNDDAAARLAPVAGGDPARLRRLAVRFADVVLPGSGLTTTAYDGGMTGRRLVVAQGRAEAA
ncbi:MAG: MaoC/PaaZ C-terminal domain-containing protein [Acidimicrobiales bacterium]